jgi:hypothetical protein
MNTLIFLILILVAFLKNSLSWWFQDNVSEWSDMSTPGLLFQWSSTVEIQLII